MKNKYLIVTLTILLVISACKKSDNNDTNTVVDATLTGKVLGHFATNVATANLLDLQNRAAELDAAIIAFVASPNQSGLDAAKQKWYATRIAWEQSEAFLFGPVATKELDPAIDSWPVNFVDIDSVIAGNSVYSNAFMDSLNPTLKGFHPIEYLLFGTNGTRQFSELSQRQLQYLLALSAHLKRITAQMHEEWSVSGGNYATQVSAAGTAASQEFATQKDAVLEVVNAMIGIVDEVGNGKIQEPFAAQNPGLEESPFSANSWTDFKNNIAGVRNVYTGQYGTAGTSLSDWVKQYNKSLDTKIAQKIDAVVSNMNTYTMPFGQAIINQPSSIAATQGLLNDLKNTLESELVPLVQQHLK